MKILMHQLLHISMLKRVCWCGCYNTYQHVLCMLDRDFLDPYPYCCSPFLGSRGSLGGFLNLALVWVEYFCAFGVDVEASIIDLAQDMERIGEDKPIVMSVALCEVGRHRWEESVFHVLYRSKDGKGSDSPEPTGSAYFSSSPLTSGSFPERTFDSICTLAALFLRTCSNICRRSDMAFGESISWKR